MKKTVWFVVGLSALAFTGGYVLYKYQQGMARVAAMNADVLPTFTEPADGTPSPVQNWMGVVVGTTTVGETESIHAQWQLECRDTSVRAMMGSAREKKRKEYDEAKARGDDLDGFSGASLLNYRSPKERNPQIRLACEKPMLKDRERPAHDGGRALYIFDSPTHPVRHVSFRRRHNDHARAEADLVQTLDALTSKFGPPHKSPPLEQAQRVDGKYPLYKSVKFEWSWPDLAVHVSAMAFGKGDKTYVSVNEVVEVPWPIRADAPAIARAGTAGSGKQAAASDVPAAAR